jgi:hypothetical protein
VYTVPSLCRYIPFLGGILLGDTSLLKSCHTVLVSFIFTGLIQKEERNKGDIARPTAMYTVSYSGLGNALHTYGHNASGLIKHG